MKKLELPIVRSAYPEILETMEREVRVPGELSPLKVLVQISGTVKRLELPIVRSAYPEVLETMERGVRVPGELSLLKVLVQVSSRRGR